MSSELVNPQKENPFDFLASKFYVVLMALGMNARALLTDRLEFFTQDKAIGFFLDRHYPSRPGRYRYEPYRGEGHAILVSLLQKGETVKCRFFCGDIEFSILIEQETFVPATPESYWFVDIPLIDPMVGPPIKTVDHTGKSIPATFPIRTLQAFGPRS